MDELLFEMNDEQRLHYLTESLIQCIIQSKHEYKILRDEDNLFINIYEFYKKEG